MHKSSLRFTLKPIFSGSLILVLLAVVSFSSCKKDSQLTRANERMLIVIDAAHGGSDTGTKSDTGLLEKDLVLQVCNSMAAIADQYNIDVIRTRTGDEDVSWEDRVAMADRPDVDLFISIHINKSTPARSADKYEVIMAPENPFPDNSRRLATTVINNLLQAGVDTAYTEKGVFVLRTNSRPAIAIECGDIDNPTHVATLQDENQLCRYFLSSVVEYGNGE